MRMQQVLIPVIATLGILGGPLLASADDSGAPPMPRKEFCKANPDKCAEIRDRRHDFCAANPEKCQQQREEMRAKRAERREFCQANPDKCKEQREAWKARREEMRAKCQSDPAKCEEMKEQRREKFLDRRKEPPQPATPPAN